MDDEQLTEELDGFDADGGARTRAEPHQVPHAMGPVMTMEVVQRYVESERNRSRRILLWTGTLSLLLVLTALVLLISVGIFSLRNSRKAADIAQQVESRTANYVADVADVAGKVTALRERHDLIRSDIQHTENRRAVEREGLENNLVKFSQWVAEGDNRGAEAVAALEFRLQEMETMLNGREKELASLRQRYGALMASLASGKIVQPSLPKKGAVTPAPDDAESELSFDELLKDFPDVTARATNAVSDVSSSPGRSVTVMTFPNGERYEGEFKDGLFHGWGVYVFQNGDRYEGEFVEDRMSGEGTMAYKNGNVYKGQFHNGVRYGQGLLTFKNGDVYDGEFKDNVRHGQGEYKFANGTRYTGDFQNNQRHGKGRYRYPSNEEFVGYFKNGQMDGPGICTYANGKQIRGIWKAGKFARAVKQDTP